MNFEIDHAHIDTDAIKIVRRLTRHHFIAYLVGGSVRDLCIGRKPKDFDLVTDARPGEIRKLFRNSRIIGRRFKLAHIFFGEDKIFETSTFRAEPIAKEGDEDLLILSDNRFGTPQEDARRRDFTVNGLFYDVIKGQIIDYVDGLKDIESRSLRTIGNPDVRFQEDPVRILRAIRFAGKLGFTIEKETDLALRRHKSALKLASRRRLVDEIWKTMLGGSIEKTLPLLKETGVLKELIPELDTQLEDPHSMELIQQTCMFIDCFHQHPLMSLSITAPLLFQDWLGELFTPERVKGDVVNTIYKERLHPLLVTYGFSRLQRDTIHRILHIVNQLGFPPLKGKLPKRLTRKEHFWAAYLVWQIMWFIRGELKEFDLKAFLRSIEELVPQTSNNKGKIRGRSSKRDASRSQKPRKGPASRSETPKSRRARSRSRRRTTKPSPEKAE